MKQSELDWFRPLWRRVAVTAFVAAWFIWETFWNQDQLWMMITGAALGNQLADVRTALISGFGMINYDRGLCTAAAIIAKGIE